MRKTELLNKSDVLWIFAIKRNIITEYYQIWNGSTNIPSYNTLYFITNDILFKSNEWNRAIFLLSIQEHHLTVYKETFRISELLWEAIKLWVHDLDIFKLKRLCGSDIWKEWKQEIEELCKQIKGGERVYKDDVEEEDK
jgi:hypothetical protein